LLKTTHLKIHGMSLGDCFTLSKKSISKKAVLSDRLFFENNVVIRFIESKNRA
jgi:hypothetical protein